ncbi:MAG TPA: N-acylglucosamine 2-epimerase [Planctomycetaceae bacterium]|nr:N-acylglucosamine 2-epimerase [Blastopirellula sp.]HAY82120.1 N-acylglucosamine 2-epimerase [Planctomycetaceae bacterium]
MDAARRSQLMDVYRDGLLQDTLPFWMNHCIDKQHGGFLTAVDRDGTIVDTDKSVWQQGRFTWLLAELYNQVEPRDAWLAAAVQGAEFIERHCVDPADGRLWFHVTREGAPIRKRRYAFSESFAAIAFGELAQATGEARYATRAQEFFQRFLSHQREPRDGTAKYTATRPMQGIGVPMITVATAQELRSSIGLADADQWIDESMETIRTKHVKPDIRCVMELVSPEGEMIDHFDGRTLNPGHAIECAWFILQEGQWREDADLIQLGCQMLDWMWERGWDDEHGGILYFVDVHGGPVQEYWHDMKFWWPQNEAIIATLLAYTLTGEEKYLRWHSLIHDWAYRFFPDPEYGEWYGYLHRDGRRSSSLKGNLWKGPFHLPRMQLLCWQMLAGLSSTDEASETAAE